MKNKFEFDFFQKNNNNSIFVYPNNNNMQNLNYLEKWSKLESKLQKNRIDNYFSNDSLSSLNLGTLQSMEWDDLKLIKTQKNNSPLKNKYKNEKNNINLPNLQKLIHPIDDEFEQYIQNKIENLEKLKTNNKNDTIFNNKNNNNNNMNTISDNIKEKINNSIRNNLFLNKEKNEEKSIIKEKNEAIFTFHKNENENNDELDKMKTKSFLNDYTYNDNNTNNSIFNTNNKDENSLGFRNRMRLYRILNRIKSNQKETEIINKPNKFRLFDTSDENSNLNKIQRRYYEQFREEDKRRDNDYSKDYFSTIIYELNKN